MAAAATAVRALRIPGVHQSIGAALFAAILFAMWRLGALRFGAGSDERRKLTVAGTLLLSPFALIALLWVGLGTPWEATAPENVTRYSVLLFGSIAVAIALVLLTGALREGGERFYSALGFAANMLAGSAYLVWMSFQLGAYVVRARGGETSESIVAMGAVNDVLLFAACGLTYAATAAFAASLGRTRWLGRGATIMYVTISSLALVFLFLRGLEFPVPGGRATAWYTQPGFVVGIPAVPWLMPSLLGVVLIRRAGEELSAVAR